MEEQEIKEIIYEEISKMTFNEIADWIVRLCKQNDELQEQQKKSNAIIETQRRRIKKLKEKQ